MTIREIFDKSTTAFNAHDMAGFADLIADDAVVRAPGGLSGTGKQACLQFFEGWLTAFPDARVAVRDLYICGDVAVEDGTFTGTHTGILQSPAGDVPPTGSKVSVDYLQTIRHRDGKQAAFDLMYDRLQLLEQLGLSPVSA
ncbi:MAG TPA: ester cyclase [Streptosporangiaceae bacterium]|nr:ester cyclase [Streptosporangiaceae bacterium]HYK67353.1 ester cyclase [Streptosporangiaceae bacterium]